MRNIPNENFAGKLSSSVGIANVTLRFAEPPSSRLISEIGKHGVVFKIKNGSILHTEHIYPAIVELDSLESLTSEFPEIISIESSFNPSRTSTLDVSNPLVNASKAWDLKVNSSNLTGKGVKIANIDTGIDIHHPAFFNPDGGVFDWIDVNKSGSFENGIDAVDLNCNSIADSGEILNFYNAQFSDLYKIIDNPIQTYNTETDWLYNDSNNNGIRDYGPLKGFTETSPSFGERVFFIDDCNYNNSLDPGEKLTSLGTSKVSSIHDKNGIHYKSSGLFSASPDPGNHGTPSSGIICAQSPGRRFTGMAPDAEIILINRNEVPDITESVLNAVSDGAKIVMYEFGAWVWEFLDGSSNIETFINDLEEQGIHQFTASGNLAGPTRKKHAFLSMNYSDTDTLKLKVPSGYNIKEVYLSMLWRGDLSYIPSTTIVLPDNSSIKLTLDEETYISGNYKIQVGRQKSTKGTSRYDFLISNTNSFTGNINFIMSNNRRIKLDIHSYVADNVTSWVGGTQFLNYVTDDGTICTPGTAEKGITVGSFDPRGYRDVKGEISDFSSWGKTIDGRRAVDITAPGFTVFSPASKETTGNIPGGFIDFNGTSASLPHVVGCSALILQAIPSISTSDLADAILSFAIKDDFTGNVPNIIWGYGKLDIYKSLTLANIATSVTETNKPEDFFVSNAYPNPFNSVTFFAVNNPSDKTVNVEIFNILGQKIQSFIVNGSGKYFVKWDGKNRNGERVASGIYLAKFGYENKSIIKKITFTK